MCDLLFSAPLISCTLKKKRRFKQFNFYQIFDYTFFKIKSPVSRSLHKDDVDIIREGNFQMKPDVFDDPGINQSCK